MMRAAVACVAADFAPTRPLETSMNFTQAVASVYRKYVTFSGRACRSEYWWYILFSIIVSVVIAFVESALGLGAGQVTSSPDAGFSASYAGGPLSIIWSLLNILPSIAVGIRRLHDTDRSGWWLLIGLVPLVGFIVLLVFFCSKGTTGANRFGNDPLGSPANVF
jgi:uncharacterized membrane protein YhaH (DUF805 family)